jgi:hypothetical protein
VRLVLEVVGMVVWWWTGGGGLAWRVDARRRYVSDAYVCCWVSSALVVCRGELMHGESHRGEKRGYHSRGESRSIQ